MTGETLVLSNKSKAIGFILLSALGFAMMSVFVRLAGDLPIYTKILFPQRGCDGRGSGAAQTRWERITGGRKGTCLFCSCARHAARSAFSATTMRSTAWFWRTRIFLNKMSPFFAILFSLFLLKERANLFQYGMVLVAFGGSMLIIKPQIFGRGVSGVYRPAGRYRCGRGLYRGPRAFPKTGEKRERDRLFLLHFFDAGHAAVSDF